MTRIPPRKLSDWVTELGGQLREGDQMLEAVSALGGEELLSVLVPWTRASLELEAKRARVAGAIVLLDASLAERIAGGWVHPAPMWALAKILATVAPLAEPQLGKDVVLGKNVVLERGVIIGDRVHIGHGSVIGGRGFGYVTGPSGEVVAIPHVGGVVIGDDVQVGNLVTIDAGTLSPTRIGAGVKIDSQVHVGHNCEIGAGTMIAAQVGFAGSVKVGRNVQIGGQSGFADHVVIGDGARIGAKSGVISGIAPGAVVAGFPAVEKGIFLRAMAKVYDRRSRS